MAAEDLQNYKLQLEQVEAALTTSADDEELLKLKKDLEDVIELTLELLKAQSSDDKEDFDLTVQKLGAESVSDTKTKLKTNWRSGDRCLGLWPEDGQYYEATVDSVEGAEVSVLFDKHRIGVPVVLTLEFLKELPRGQDKTANKRKQPTTKEREYMKKKKLKKQMRFKQLEEERETEKNKWLSFNTKANKKGIVKKSIFASPDNVNGRVGVGTCGVSGRGMTEFQHAEKHKK